MKKIIALILVGLLLISVVGCGAKDENIFMKQKIKEEKIINPAGNEIGTRGYIEMKKADFFDEFENNEKIGGYIEEFFEKEVTPKKYNWFNIFFEDGTTLLFVGSMKEMCIYGKNEDGDGTLHGNDHTFYRFKDGKYVKAEV